jgi:oxygen-independent coproporphyrinogen-3 oxidase
MNPYSLYLHIPFCLHRCGYCDFNTYSGLESLIPAYVAALCAEIRSTGHSAGAYLPVHTLFFGGGTPSLLSALQVENILSAIGGSFNLMPGLEVTLEANPGALSQDYLRQLRGLGVNRLSLGLQSAHPGELRLLERGHTYPDVIQSVKWARQAGFENLNLDLIFGLPEQELASWQRTVHLAIGLQPEHFSLYALSIEHGAPFSRWVGRGLLSAPDPDLAADMYEWAQERLSLASYAQYEISNWARNDPASPSRPSARAPSFACRHNLQYWRNLPYLGFGAGAHGYAAGRRTANLLSPAAYIHRLTAPSAAPSPSTMIKPGPEPSVSSNTGAPAPAYPFPLTPATQDAPCITQEAEIAETMMMGLRLTQEGVSAAQFQRRFGQSLADRFASQIARLERLGLIEWAQPAGETVLRLTPKGYLLGNQVFVEFI